MNWELLISNLGIFTDIAPDLGWFDYLCISFAFFDNCNALVTYKYARYHELSASVIFLYLSRRGWNNIANVMPVDKTLIKTTIY